LAGTLGGSNVESLMPINIKPPPLPTAEEEEDDSSYVDLTSDMIRELALQAQSAFKTRG